MARSHTAALLAALLIAALSPAAAQPVSPVLTAPGPAAPANTPDLAPESTSTTAAASPAPAPAKAAGPATDIATTTTIGSGSSAVTARGVAPSSEALAGGEAPNNRTVGTQLVVPPGGCLVVSVTSASDLCLQDASFSVNNQSIAIPADYRAAGIPNSNTFFNNTSYKANNPSCQNNGSSVTQAYEVRGCILASAATTTVGAATATDIRNSFVCTTSGTDTTNYARAFGATAQEKAFCTEAIKNAQKAISAGSAAAQSGDPCTAARATFIIPNPCPDYNTTVNTTGRFFLAADVQAPAPAPELLAPVAAPEAAPGSAPELAPAPSTAPGFAPAPAPSTGPAAAGTPTAGASAAGTAAGVAPVPAPAPAPQSASRTTVFSAAAAVAALACGALV